MHLLDRQGVYRQPIKQVDIMMILTIIHQLLVILKIKMKMMWTRRSNQSVKMIWTRITMIFFKKF